MKNKKKQNEKGLRNYIFEFFMVFLAIVGGFFMENVRERYSDQQKGKMYLTSMISDIKEDSATMQDLIHKTKIQVKGMDSLLQILEHPDRDTDLESLYLYTSRYLNTLEVFSQREIAITQLKNSGGFRFINNKSVLDSIVVYYSSSESHQGQLSYLKNLLEELLNLELSVMDFSYFSVPNREPSFESSKIKEFYNRILWFRLLLEGEINWLKDYQRQAISLQDYLKSEYRIK